MSAEMSAGALEQLALCERARATTRTRPTSGCTLPWCTREAQRPGGLCAHHADMAREDPTAGELATLARWGWRRVSVGEWMDSQGKYRAHWRTALARIAADERRGDLA